MSSSKMLTYLNIGHFLDHYFLMTFPLAAIAIERDWQLDYSEALALGTPLYVGFALGTLPAGWLGDACKREHLIAALFLGCGLASVGIAMAPNTILLMTGLGALGLFASIYHPVGLSMVTSLTNRPGRTLAINGVYGNLGLAASSLATGTLAEFIGWRSAFLIPGVIAISVGLWFCIAYRSNLASISASRTECIVPMKLVSRSAQWRVIVVVMVAALFGGMVFNGVTVTLPKLFEIRLSDSIDQLSGIGAYSALVFAVAAFAQLPIGALLDRFGGKPILGCLLLFQSLVLLVISGIQGAAVVPIAMILVLLMFAELPVTGWLVGRYVPSNWRSRTFAAEYVLSLGMNALIVPMIAALHSWNIGFDKLYTGFAVSAAIVLVAVFVLPAYRPHPQLDTSKASYKSGV
jgi:MFS family permease